MNKGPRVAQQKETQPTTGRLLGPLADLGGQRAYRHPSPGRVGMEEGTSTNTGPSERETEPLARKKSWGKTQRRLAWPGK